MKLSPMMEQYFEIKEQYPDCILFFRLGDFYELFYEDAKIGSKELELTLTGKSCGQEERAPMCGVPFHAADSYIKKMVERGYKVAICEQVEDPREAKGIVKREVIQVVTPGTLTEASMLTEDENNYLATVYFNEEAVALAYTDISTGELNLTEYHGEDIYQTMLNELVKIKASEIIVSTEFESSFDMNEIKHLTEAYFTVLPETYFTESQAVSAIKAQFNTIGLTGLGLDFRPAATICLGVLLNYLLETQKQNLKHLTHINIYEIGSHMALDKATLRNLEITETLYDKSYQGSLLGVLDKTHTAMGSRKMRNWLREPLNDADEINDRLDAVEELYNEVLLRNNIKECLKAIYDFERLAGRISYGNANGKDLIALKNSIAVLPEIKGELSDSKSKLLREICENIDVLSEVYDVIDRAIVLDPPFIIKEGGLIKPGYSEELDNLKFSIKDGKTWISNLEETERERTGIRTIKVGYNKVFGYYIEVSNSFKDQVPMEYIRKQTLVNGERFITPELKEMENLVLNAEAKINEMEYNIFLEIRSFIQGFIEKIQRTSNAISELDVLTAFATVSEKYGYVKPEINNSMVIEIVKGRHPVIEQMTKDGLFISNDTFLNDKDSSLLLITGPNMSGKSTYMRQTALIVLMAQAGCYVPCERAKIGVCDRIFTRIGASDNLAQGQSTFYVEMSELSYILNNAKERSLIILDEIGRGTSTYDGLSIAWALVEHLANENTHIRTLFATHYHELTQLEDSISGVKNLNVDVAEENGNIVFLHKIAVGPASRSYGIHVAKLAGVPKSMLDRADDILYNLECTTNNNTICAKQNTLTSLTYIDDSNNCDLGSRSVFASGSKEKVAGSKKELAPLTDYNIEKKHSSYQEQLSLFDLTPDPVLAKLRELDLMNITPSEAIKILEDLKKNID